MTTDWRIIRVFISSTFRDMQAERDHLVTVVFLELRLSVKRYHDLHLVSPDAHYANMIQRPLWKQPIESNVNPYDLRIALLLFFRLYR